MWYIVCYASTVTSMKMTLTNNSGDYLSTKTDILDESSWDALYCSHIWSNSNLRKAILSAPYPDNKVIKYCYTCKGKIRKYEIKSGDCFVPKKHSTPNCKTENREEEASIAHNSICVVKDFASRSRPRKDIETISSVENNDCIPTISRQVDSSFRQKYTSYEMRPHEISQRRLRKSLKGIGCIVNLALNDTPVKKRTQIQACSISVMILAIVSISFVLVNFTSPNFTRANNVASTIVVPTKIIDSNETSSAITNVNTDPTFLTDIQVADYTTPLEPFPLSRENNSHIANVISKIRKNIRTFPKDMKKDGLKPKDIIHRDLSQKFCSCQTNEVCMLDENTGKSICRKAIYKDDPTGCGGLCALETEACQLVDRARGVRVCRLLTLVTCSPQEWRCRNGFCIKAEQRCDGAIQCYDKSDEMYCDCNLAKQFRCGHSISCFSKTKLCDGVIDCWDGYDERNCTNECPEDQFTCTDGQCILWSRFCDRFADCADGSDEPSGCDGECSPHEMRCGNRRCVPHSAKCDGHDNCGDRTDELHCS